MPNQVNVPLTGKKGNKKKKNRKKQKQQQPAFWLRPQVPKNTIVVLHAQAPNRTLLQIPQVPLPQAQKKVVYQAPHHQQESMIDLTDDTSPNIAVSGAGWKPIGTDTTPNKQNPTQVQITPTRQEKWLKFQESLNAKFIEKAETKKQLFSATETTENTAEEPTMSQQKIEDNAPETSWEMNEKDGMSSKEIVQGTASEIRLTLQNKEKSVFIDRNKNTDQNSRAGPSFVHYEQNNLSSSQLLKLNATDPRYNLPGQYPKGVPRSFLIQQQALGAIQPQDQIPGQNPPQQWSSTPKPNSKWDQPPAHLQNNQPQSFEAANYSNEEAQQYSPTDTYEDSSRMREEHDGSESPESQTGNKRLSAFQRLGPLSQPKKPKLTINLLCSKEQSVREVVDQTENEDKYTPVHLRKNVVESRDETVMKFLPYWPWRRNVSTRKTVTARASKSVMILEQEQMEEIYDKDNIFIQVSVRGYPPSWRKEDILDVMLEAVRGKTFIPCFVDFTPQECKFLVIRSCSALITFHKLGFFIRKDDVELRVLISQTDVSLKQLDFIPRLILRKRLSMNYDGERKLSLQEFTLKSDISNFIYFPIHRLTNQGELVSLQSTVAWDYLTDLNLSHNRLTSIDGFDLPKTTPRLKHLDLSYNHIEKVTAMLRCRELSLRSLRLEGNPLCHDYTDPGHYVKVIKMIFPALTEIDGVPVHLKGDFPLPKRNYCPADATEVANKFLEIFFPLLELPCDEKGRIMDIYDDKAVLTITYRYNLRYSSVHRKFRNLFLRARVFDEGDVEAIEGASSIARLISKWPDMQHDRYTFTLDVMHHNETSIILRVGGILKLTAETLADDEYLVAFTRTVVLTTLNGSEYKIMNEMLYWDEPHPEFSRVAFQMNSIITKRLSLKLDSTPDDDLKEKLTDVFMKITHQDKEISEKCLAEKQWNLKTALEYFIKFVKLDDLDSLRK